MTAHKRFDARLNVYVSAELQRKLEQIRDQRGPKVTVPDIVREAIRQYVDNEEDIIGSRRHFQRNLREAVDGSRFQLMWTQLVLMAFLWQGFSATGPDTPSALPQFKDVFARSILYTARNWKPLMSALRDALDGAVPDEPTRETP